MGRDRSSHKASVMHRARVMAHMRTLVLLVAALTLAGCTGGEPDTSPTPGTATPPAVTPTIAPTGSTPPPTATPAATPPPVVTPTSGPVSPVAVVIQYFEFSPPDVTIPNGTTVGWRNADTSGHTATHPTEFNSGRIASGGEFRHTFNSPGVFAYQCAFHPEMTGTVTVNP